MSSHRTLRIHNSSSLFSIAIYGDTTPRAVVPTGMTSAGSECSQPPIEIKLVVYVLKETSIQVQTLELSPQQHVTAFRAFDSFMALLRAAAGRLLQVRHPFDAASFEMQPFTVLVLLCLATSFLLNSVALGQEAVVNSAKTVSGLVSSSRTRIVF